MSCIDFCLSVFVSAQVVAGLYCGVGRKKNGKTHWGEIGFVAYVKKNQDEDLSFSKTSKGALRQDPSMGAE